MQRFPSSFRLPKRVQEPCPAQLTDATTRQSLKPVGHFSQLLFLCYFCLFEWLSNSGHRARMSFLGSVFAGLATYFCAVTAPPGGLGLLQLCKDFTSRAAAGRYPGKCFIKQDLTEKSLKTHGGGSAAGGESKKGCCALMVPSWCYWWGHPPLSTSPICVQIYTGMLSSCRTHHQVPHQPTLCAPTQPRSRPASLGIRGQEFWSRGEAGG